MKLAIISDAHLLQTYTKVFDPIEDFINVVEKIKEQNPDAILFAGDMFDKRKTRTTPVLHPEGEQTLTDVRRVLDDADFPIYAIRGNHEDSRVLDGLDQAVDNFHYVRDGWVTVDDVPIYCLDTRYERAYSRENLEDDVERIFSEFEEREDKGGSILLCHETFIPGKREFPPDLRTQLASEFDLVLNGHLHSYDPNATDDENIVFLPALLPSKLRLGDYWQEKYEWTTGGAEFESDSRESPFGYVAVDDDLTPSFSAVEPALKIVELVIDATELSQGEVRSRFHTILESISERNDKDRLAVVPRVTGKARFAVSLLRNIPDQYQDLLIDDIADDTEGTKTEFSPGEQVDWPLLTVDGLKRRINESVDEIVSNLSDEGVEVDKGKLQKATSELLEDDVLEKGSGERVGDYMRSSLEKFASTLQNEGILEPTPKDFNKYLRENLDEVSY